jgi:secreted trypsin-like serine protease
LISQRLVITAAHCIHNKNEPVSNRRKPEEATFFFGKHNIESLTEDRNYIQSGAIEFHLHQDWRINDDKFDADIAIVVLSRRIPFNKFIKPICLWTSTSSFTDLIDKEGIIAGWGKTEFNAISTSMPKWTKLPVVSNEICLRSHPIFSTLTSERTFCAGIKDSITGPCNGDSGSGFIHQVNNKYYLRGIVSSSLFNNVQQSCDTKNYAVFTDVARYTTWIQLFMNRFG